MSVLLFQLESAEQKAFVTGPWELESEFGHQDGPGKLSLACHIAVCPNQDTVVADLSNTVCLYSKEAQYKFQLNLKEGMDPGVTPYPRNVTVNADGLIYVTCNVYVLVYVT